MEMRTRTRAALIATAHFAAFMPLLVHAVPVSYSSGPLVFSTSGQSMWGTGSAGTFADELFIGRTWDVDRHFGGIDCISNPLGSDPCGGAEVRVRTDGRAGLNFGVRADSGTVNALMKFDASALLPDASTMAIGQYFNLNPNSLLSGGALQTWSPKFEATASGVLGARARFNIEACVVACIDSDTGWIGYGSRSNPHSRELVSINQGGNGALQLLNQTAPYNFGQEIEVVGALSVTPYLPRIDTAGGVSGGRLRSSGHDDVLALTLDIDRIFTDTFGIPPLSGSRQFAGVEVDYTLFDADISGILELQQSFELAPTLWVDLQFSNPVWIHEEGMDIGVSSLRTPWASLPDIALLTSQTTVVPTFFVTAALRNTTRLGIDAEFDIEALSARITNPGPNIGSIGPLYSRDFRFDGADFDPMFNDSFWLGGFNTIRGEAFTLGTRETISVPEPAPLVSFGLCLLVFGSRRILRRDPPVSSTTALKSRNAVAV